MTDFGEQHRPTLGQIIELNIYIFGRGGPAHNGIWTQSD